jgi:hypothetical protein
MPRHDVKLQVTVSIAKSRTFYDRHRWVKLERRSLPGGENSKRQTSKRQIIFNNQYSSPTRLTILVCRSNLKPKISLAFESLDFVISAVRRLLSLAGTGSASTQVLCFGRHRRGDLRLVAQVVADAIDQRAADDDTIRFRRDLRHLRAAADAEADDGR